MEEIKVLYCGMGDDILSPLLIVPKLTTLFVIDLFDSAFAKNHTFEGQKSDIKQCLIEGSNENSWHREVLLKYVDDVQIHQISPCKITYDNDDEKRWELRFIYNNIERKLISFHHTNFIGNWDEEIFGIKHLMCMGAEFPLDNLQLQNMISDRCYEECNFYDQIHKSKSEIFAVSRHPIYVNILDQMKI